MMAIAPSRLRDFWKVVSAVRALKTHQLDFPCVKGGGFDIRFHSHYYWYLQPATLIRLCNNTSTCSCIDTVLIAVATITIPMKEAKKGGVGL